MKKLHPIVQEALSRPIHYWEMKSLHDLSDVLSELLGEGNDVASMACEEEISETTTTNNAVHTFRCVADNVQLRLLNEVRIVEQSIFDAGASNTADIDEL